MHKKIQPTPQVHKKVNPPWAHILYIQIQIFVFFIKQPFIYMLVCEAWKKITPLQGLKSFYSPPWSKNNSTLTFSQSPTASI